MYEFFHGLFQGFLDKLLGFFTWLGTLFQGMFQGIEELFTALFKPIIVFLNGIFYLLTQCFYIVVLVVQVVFGIFKVLGAVIAGIFNTFSQLLSFTGGTGHYSMPSEYQQGWGIVTDFLNSTGFSTIAVIMTAFIWMMTAYAVIRIAGGER